MPEGDDSGVVEEVGTDTAVAYCLNGRAKYRGAHGTLLLTSRWNGRVRDIPRNFTCLHRSEGQGARPYSQSSGPKEYISQKDAVTGERLRRSEHYDSITSTIVFLSITSGRDQLSFSRRLYPYAFSQCPVIWKRDARFASYDHAYLQSQREDEAIVSSSTMICAVSTLPRANAADSSTIEVSPPLTPSIWWRNGSLLGLLRSLGPIPTSKTEVKSTV